MSRGRPSAGPGEEDSMAKAKRTTHRSSKGKKLYAVRDKQGRFKDIQTYKRAHSADLRRKSTDEKKRASSGVIKSTSPSPVTSSSPSSVTSPSSSPAVGDPSTQPLQ